MGDGLGNCNFDILEMAQRLADGPCMCTHGDCVHGKARELLASVEALRAKMESCMQKDCANFNLN